ncbi:WXG100 family type VII secretion target [Streptacidiphilus sp. ASG 303]|uniref:WXG100 family type VII secretion target n=1 Tax=Streptacidiphilus sp. ASG 303 TaxID=2896847 RepID=UPI001E443089|nr:WXG100 family type VII secretion target [Streptacidiphilus sp. ASG 303]MCD0484583.1 WXG100 family type VII secretion target [Streptacidiphilus sp. ASG 303]
MIPADTGGGGPIDVTPEDLHQVALAFARGQDRLDHIADTLGSALRGAAGMAGDDRWGHAFATSYDPAARALFPVLSAAVRAVGQAADGLVRTANNYLKADHHSDAKARTGSPRLFGPPPVIADVMYPDPPSSIGPGSNHWPPPIDRYWPDGHQDRLRDAAAAYRQAAADLDDTARDLHLQVQALTDNNSSASLSAMADFWGKIWQDCDAGGDAPLSTAHLACLRLAAVCERFAQAVDHAHSEFEHKAAEAGLAIGATTILGVLGTVVTLGGSDAGAAALDAGEAAAIFATVDGVMDAAVADYAAEGIADLETVLASAAEGVPEVETAEAETTEVAQTLEREMADTEARQPSPSLRPGGTPRGVGGRGGGGGEEPPTGGGRGGESEPGEEGELPPGRDPGVDIDKLSADDILKDDGEVLGENTGRKMPVRSARDKAELDRLWDKLTDGAPRPGPGQKVSSYTRPDGVRVQYRNVSGSGGETIDINATQAGGRIWKIHLPRTQ